MAQFCRLHPDIFTPMEPEGILDIAPWVEITSLGTFHLFSFCVSQWGSYWKFFGISSHIEGLSAFLVPHSLWQPQWQSKHSTLNSLCGSHYCFSIWRTALLRLSFTLEGPVVLIIPHFLRAEKWINLCLKDFNIDSSQKGSFCSTSG